jgi:hypothetical protein
MPAVNQRGRAGVEKTRWSKDRRSLLSLATNTKFALLLRAIGWGSAHGTALPYSNWILEYWSSILGVRVNP